MKEMEHFRWITFNEANIHHYAEAMGRLKESGYVPPYGWDWGYWTEELRHSTFAHFLYKLLVNETRRIKNTVAGGGKQVTNLSKEEATFIKDTSAEMSVRLNQALSEHGNMGQDGMMVLNRRKVKK